MLPSLIISHSLNTSFFLQSFKCFITLSYGFSIMTAIDSVFTVYGLLTILLIIMTYVILRRSLSTVNYLFSFTPVTFILVLVLNMLNYFTNINAIIPRIPYLLAPLGILFAGIYIFYGKDFFKNPFVIFLTLIYVCYTIFISICTLVLRFLFFLPCIFIINFVLLYQNLSVLLILF